METSRQPRPTAANSIAAIAVALAVLACGVAVAAETIDEPLQVNGKITSSEPAAGANNYLRIEAGPGAARAGIQLVGDKAPGVGDFGQISFRSDFQDIVLTVGDVSPTSGTSWREGFSFAYVDKEFDFKKNILHSAARIGVGTDEPQAALHVVGLGGPADGGDFFEAVVEENDPNSPDWAGLLLSGIGDGSTHSILGLSDHGNPAFNTWLISHKDQPENALQFTLSRNQAPWINAMTIRPIGNTDEARIGIGRTDPSESLHVSGSVRADQNVKLIGSIWMPSVETQSLSRILHNAAGSSSLFLGLSAGESVNAGNASSQMDAENTGIGTRALSRIWWGTYNTAVGSGALENVQTGSHNTAFGREALNLANDWYNTAVGSEALRLATGGGNTAVGSSALMNLGGAYENTALGMNALSALTSGDSNVALGPWAGSSLLGGDSNIYISSTGAQNESGIIRIGNSEDHEHTYLQGPVTIEEYTLPEIDGTDGQVLVTDGNGNVGWEDMAAGGSGLWSANGSDITNVNSGNVGIGTNTPNEQLELTGNLRLPPTTNTGGAILVDAKVFVHNYGPQGQNTFVGVSAGNRFMGALADGNTGIGYAALTKVQTGGLNTAVGAYSMELNTSGSSNTAIGHFALQANTIGGDNTAIGEASLQSNKTGNDNTAVGIDALSQLDGGSGNIAIGEGAGSTLTSSSDNIYIANPGAQGESGVIRIGNLTDHSSVYVAGIQPATFSGLPVVVDENTGRLAYGGLSSRQFKTAIEDAEQRSSLLYELDPVMFEYLPEIDPTGTKQYGLLAEEVMEVAPEMVVCDSDGQPIAVRYDQLTPLLVEEIQQQSARIEQLESEVAELCQRLIEIEELLKQ